MFKLIPFLRDALGLYIKVPNISVTLEENSYELFLNPCWIFRELIVGLEYTQTGHLFALNKPCLLLCVFLFVFYPHKLKQLPTKTILFFKRMDKHYCLFQNWLFYIF